MNGEVPGPFDQEPQNETMTLDRLTGIIRSFYSQNSELSEKIVSDIESVDNLEINQQDVDIINMVIYQSALISNIEDLERKMADYHYSAHNDNLPRKYTIEAVTDLITNSYYKIKIALGKGEKPDQKEIINTFENEIK